MTPFDPFFHTVAILNSGSPNPEFVGSGVLLRIEGEDYIATAAHVIDDLRGPVRIPYADINGMPLISGLAIPLKRLYFVF